MADCFENLSAWAQSQLSFSVKNEEQRCRYCRRYGKAITLKKCSGCSKRGHCTTYYCSKECQKSDWPDHKQECKFHQSLVEVSEGVRRTLKEAGVLKLRSLITKWHEHFYHVLIWAMEHAYHFNPTMDPTKQYFEFRLDPKTLQIHSYTFRSKTDGTELLKLAINSQQVQDSGFEDGLAFWYAVVIDGHDELPILFKPDYTPALPRWFVDRSAEWPNSHWAWITSHVTRRMEGSTWAAIVRWELLCMAAAVISRLGDLDKYGVPQMKLGERLILGDMTDWYESVNREDVWSLMESRGMVESIIKAPRATRPNQPARG